MFLRLELRLATTWLIAVAASLAGSVPVRADFHRGDANADGTVNISDPLATLGFLFQGADDLTCLDAADTNDSGRVDISDASFSLNFLFAGGSDIPAPGPSSCGPDPTADGIGCAVYEGCTTAGTPEDLDGDGLLNLQETDGWSIFIDESGLGQGNVIERRVTSDPGNPDTDGDGIGDGDEFLLRTDPRRRDTDGDSLEDREELERWETNPNSVDTDNDSRGREGNLQPTSLFFDGLETRFIGTSPSLEDTDGDGLTDFEEHSDPARSPILADLPGVRLAVAGEIDVRLHGRVRGGERRAVSVWGVRRDE